jgi:methyl-accepting chemotaxis protein
MPYKDSNPTYNVNRKVANFGDFTSNIDAEKEQLKKVKRSFTPNSDRQQFVRNSRTEYNPVTHKLTDYTEGEVEDKIKAIEELEESTNERLSGDALYAIGDSFNKVNQELELLNKRLGWATETNEELNNFSKEVSEMKIKFDKLLVDFNDFDNKHFGR